ncbi:MAG: fibrobacter succinogenes major paralogous domain-containing protein [Bacteroidaceae bacterium]|nr:fibrobacter succinogenes major paralogous domain-containing protein [Prevotellaceae bacterium]MDY5631723.1 fibrobacter succinogenes major paralogous domain-containing protein [Bacteroidaceae bacterium]
MKTSFLTAAILVAPLFLAACNENEPDTAKAEPQATGEWTDSRDNHVYFWVQYGNQQWTTTNLAYHVAGDTIYEGYSNSAAERAQNLADFGRLYTHAQALQAVPAEGGWRLPTDKDWQELEQYMGMSARDAARTDWRGNIASLVLSIGTQRKTPLNLLLGGYFTGHTIMGTSGFRFKDAAGYYWTATRDTQKEGEYYFYRRLFYNRADIYRQSMEPTAQRLSVRLVRDARHTTN